MEKIVDFASLPEHYTADACVVWCFDDRFYKIFKAFGKQERWRHIDLVKAAGGAKALGAGDPSSPSPERDFLLTQIKLSMQLHGTRRVVLMTHRDCGAYGGSKAFPDNAVERTTHEGQLAVAREFVKNELKNEGVQIDACFADFDGLYRL